MKKQFKLIISWILLIVWMIVIFDFSSQTGAASSDLSDSLVYRFVGLFFDDMSSISEITIHYLIFFVRKAAHMVEYGILGLLFYNALNNYQFFRLKLNYWAWGFSTIYALSDELHQTFVIGRSGSLVDVLIDSAGVIFMLLIIRFIRKCIEKYYV